mmetsp:Transcript_49520/g.130653  ORF Transcript_49520/g.130653 Transcript_49520/m.130653 type:complete len:137 (+) Transcript_49520:422-832(+)
MTRGAAVRPRRSGGSPVVAMMACAIRRLAKLGAVESLCGVAAGDVPEQHRASAPGRGHCASRAPARGGALRVENTAGVSSGHVRWAALWAVCDPSLLLHCSTPLDPVCMVVLAVGGWCCLAFSVPSSINFKERDLK